MSSKKFITLESDGLHSSHPAVEKIWMTGGFSIEDYHLPHRERRSVIQINIITKNGKRGFFENEDHDIAISEAEKFLELLGDTE